MTHIDEGSLLAFLDQEMPLDQRRLIERHLASCEACLGELTSLRSLSAHFAGAVAHLDGPPRALQTIGGSGASRLRGVKRHLPRAAVLVLFAAAAASATVPGSPVREWLRGLAARPPVETVVVENPVEAPAPPADLPFEAGVSVEAAEGRLEIVLQEAGNDLKVRAVLVEGTRAGVYAAGAAASSRFQTSTGRIEVLNARAGELRIELPREAIVATVTVNGREYLRKQDGRLDLRVNVPEVGSSGIDFSVEP